MTFSDSYVEPNGLNGRTLQYEYDGEQRITKVTDSVDGVTEYTYDMLGQLICEKRNGVATDITYDEYGNILSKGGKTYAYGETNADLLTSYDGTAISYGSGVSKALNPIVYRGMNLTWTKGRQLASANSNEKTITFSYNPKGIRIGKTVNGVKHDYVLEGTKLVRDMYNGVDYLYDAEDQVCGMVYDGNAYYFYKNLQGDVIAITNASGIEIARYSYDAWGVCTITGLTEFGTAVANKNVFRYRSYIYDADLGLYYLQSRYYDPQTGRFINGDDVAYLGANETALSYNLFIYCESDPVNYNDQSGMAPTRFGVLYMGTSHSELLNQFKATVDAYFRNNVVYERHRIVGNFSYFKRGWEAVKNCDIVFIDLHGNPEGLYDDKERIVLTNGNARSLPNINAKAVFLNCCNAGHYDYRRSSIAHFLKFKICGSLLGSDGSVSGRFNSNLNTYVFSSVADEGWRIWCMKSSYHRLRKKNNGWMLYQNGKSPKYLSSDIQYNITFPKFMNYLIKNHLY